MIIVRVDCSTASTVAVTVIFSPGMTLTCAWALLATPSTIVPHTTAAVIRDIVLTSVVFTLLLRLLADSGMERNGDAAQLLRRRCSDYLGGTNTQLRHALEHEVA